MANVIHVMKDGTETKSIAGKVIETKDFEMMYQVISNIAIKKEGDGNERKV